MNRKKLLSMVCILLFISLPIAEAAELTDETDELETGETIAVNVKSYEPTILTSNLIEDNDVPVYVYLAGSTLGTLIGSEYNVEPVYGGIEIDKVRIEPLTIDTEEALAGEPKYFKPNKFTDNTLGYLLLNLKQIELEEDVPKAFNLSFSAEIWFKEAERLYSLSKTALVLPENPDEDVWTDSLEQYGALYSFFGGRGLIRVNDIEGSTVDLTVYSNKDLYWPIIGAPRAIADLSLKEGETSDYLDLGLTEEEVLKNAKFRVTISDIKDPSLERATVQVQVGGKLSQVIVTEGSALYPSSSWTVKSIAQGRTHEGATEYGVVIKDRKGNKETITTTVGSGFSNEDNALLNKKFYDTSQKDTNPGQLYYTASTRSLQETRVSELKSLFANYRVDVDVSDLAGDDTRTESLSLKSGTTLKEVLIVLLPPGYFYEIVDADTIAIKRFSTVDPCDNALTYEDDEIADIVESNEVEYNNEIKLNVLCTSVKELRQVVDNYDDEKIDSVPVVDMAYDHLAKVYATIQDIGSLSSDQKLGAKEARMYAYQKLVERKSTIGDVNFQDELNRLQLELYGEVDYGTESVDDNGQSVFVKLIEITSLDAADLSSSDISVDGITTTYALGSRLFAGALEDEGGLYNWELSTIEDDYVLVKKVYSEVKKSSKARSDSEKLEIGEREKIGDYSIVVKTIDTKKEAHLTITPGTGSALRSVSNFSIHIPVEKRAIPLNPDKIDDRIEKARKLQEKLEKLSADLEKVVKYWTTVCLGVFAFVTIKSSFGKVDSDARHDAVYGVDDTSGWAAYCQENSGYGKKKYATYDKCMLENAQLIQEDIDKAQEAKKYVEDLKGDYTKEQWYKDQTTEYDGSLELCEMYLGGDAYLDSDSKKDIAYLYQLQKSEAFANVDGDVDKTIEGYTGEDLGDLTNKQKACKDVANAAASGAYDYSQYENDPKQLAAKQKEDARGLFESSYNEATGDPDVFDTKNFPALNSDIFTSLKAVGNVYKGKTKTTGIVYSVSGKIDVNRLTYNDYKNFLQDKKTELEALNTAEAQQKLSLVEADLAKFDIMTGIFRQQPEEEISAKEGGTFYFDKETGTIYLGLESYTSEELREDYADGAKFEVYGSGASKGLPYGVPYKNGNWIQIRSYTPINEIDEIWYWNVGPDGQLNTNDDVLLAHESELFYKTANPSYERLVTHANKWVKDELAEGQIIEINGHQFTVSYGKSKAVLDGAASSCFDVMNPADCKALFNACDPVMCPPSRFNLGGRWQVDNVVESGMIGSLVLGAGNGDAVPVCLSGVLASLKYWNSMLEGYVECLEAAKYEGKSVGICDKVRNVYMCELIVREVASIIGSSKGGILDFLANKVYSYNGGGGEYLNFKENLQEMERAVSYFTTEYATTTFASFQGRTLEEVGTEICQQAIYARTPWFQDFMNQITRPEDPSQFYATVVSKPFAPSQRIDAYSLYYHIYAGNNANIERIVYTVYLRNSISGEVSYATETCGGTTATLELTEMTDQNLDCTAPEGFDQVCVVINGDTQCGFGSVGTAFSSNYLKDAIVADEAKRNIDSEEECYPSVSTASPTVSEVGTLGATDQLVLPYTYGALTTGIQRVCSIDDPGTGQGNSADWVKVGTCGDDDAGRSLGSCWINTESLTIRDAKKEESVNDYLKQISTELDAGLSEGDLWNADTSAQYYNVYSADVDASGVSCPALLSAISLFRDLSKRTLSNDYGAAAEFQIGNAYYSLVDSCGLQGRTEIDYTVYLDGNEIGKEDRIKVQPGIGTLSVDVDNLLDDEEPTGDFACDIDLSRSGRWNCILDVDVPDAEYEQTFTITIKRAIGDDYTQTFTLYASASSTAAEEKTTEEAADVCSLGCGWYDPFCPASYCLEQGSSCYWDDGIVNRCLACEDITGDSSEEKCNALSDSQLQCETTACYSEFLATGKCVWDEDAYTGEQCTFESGSRKSSVGSVNCDATGGDSAYENAFLDMIAWAEGADYDTIVGGMTFDIGDCKDGHPNEDVYIARLGVRSDAAGRYQFLHSTYIVAKTAGYFSDGRFCPLEQDEAALYLAEQRGVSSKDIRDAAGSNSDSDEWQDIFDEIAPEWASIPMSEDACESNSACSRHGCENGEGCYGQGAKDANNLVAVFNTCWDAHR